jgi:two-component system sensor histidine kinase PhoQ
LNGKEKYQVTPLSLHWRVLLLTVLFLGSGIALLSIALEKILFTIALDAQEKRLSGLLYACLSASDFDAPPYGLKFSPDSRLNQRDSGLFLFITSHEQRLWQSLSTPERIAPPPIELPSSLGEFRFYSARDQFWGFFRLVWIGKNNQELPLVFYLSEDKQAFDAQLHSARSKIRFWLFSLSIALLFLLLTALYFGLQPLRRLEQEVLSVEQGKRSGLSVYYPREIKKIAENINLLLRSERERQNHYRQALDDFAHSIKTPLAVLKNSCQQLEKDKAQKLLLEQIERINQSTARQLYLAEQRVYFFRPTKQLSAHLVTERLITGLKKVYLDKAIDFHNAIDPKLYLALEEVDALEIFGNLLDNACKWCKKNIVLSSKVEGKNRTIIIIDDGPGIPETARQWLMQPGARLDESQPGQGLGLATVKKLLEGYGGTLTIDPPPGGRLRVTFSK